MERCDFTDLPAASCAHCLGHVDPVVEARRLRTDLLHSGRGWFPAQFPGTCGRCGDRFEVGAAIRMEVASGWRAECCAEAAL